MAYFLQYVFMNIFMFFVHLLPWKAAYALGVFLGSLLHIIFGSRTRLARQNIDKAIGKGMSDKEKDQLVRNVYRNFGKTLIEFVKIIRWDNAALRRMVKIEGIENLKKACESNKGVILLTGHIGNWHVMGMALGSHGYKVTNVIKRQKNPWVAHWIVDQVYRARMKSIFQNNKNPRQIIKALRNREIVEFLGDLHAGDRGIFVDFMGRPASTFTGPVILAIRTGAPIVVAVDVRNPDNTHTAFIDEPIYLDRSRTSDEDVHDSLGVITKGLESYILKYPDQWFWLHNRWKTQPKDGA
ncbi:MAG: lysophospholipid acyltransferase family protein [bacterium]